MRQIPLSQGHVALVDDADYDLVSGMTWHLEKRGQVRYARCQKTNTYLHKLLGPTGGLVSFKDGNSLNCQRANLRVVTYTERQYGRRKRAGMTSQFKGVSKCKATGMWRADICLPGKRVNLGRYASEIEAAAAYNEAAEKYFGDFARLNDLLTEQKEAFNEAMDRVEGMVEDLRTP